MPELGLWIKAFLCLAMGTMVRAMAYRFFFIDLCLHCLGHVGALHFAILSVPSMLRLRAAINFLLIHWLWILTDSGLGFTVLFVFFLSLKVMYIFKNNMEVAITV